MPTLGDFTPMLRTAGKVYDELTREHGLKLFDEMVLDAEVSASWDIIKSASTLTPLQFKPALEPNHRDYQKAVAVSDFCNWSLDGCLDDFHETRQLSVRDALKYGTSLSEVTYQPVKRGIYRNLLRLTGFRSIPIESYDLLVDSFGRIQGAISRVTPAAGFLGSLGIGGFPSLETNQIIPKSKLHLFRWNPNSSSCTTSALGTSILTPAFPAWWLKNCLLMAWSIWLKRMSGRFIYATAPADVSQVCKTLPNGDTENIDITDFLSEELANLDNYGVGAFPNGVEINVIEHSKVADHLLGLMAQLNSEIRRGIELQTQASGESINQSRASSMTQQNILSLRIMSVKASERMAMRSGWLREWVTLNFGEDNFHLTPMPYTGDGDGFPLSAFEFAQLVQVGAIAQEQLPAMWARFDLPQVNGEYTLLNSKSEPNQP
jgi:hypothetical protein